MLGLWGWGRPGGLPGFAGGASAQGGGRVRSAAASALPHLPRLTPTSVRGAFASASLPHSPARCLCTPPRPPPARPACSHLRLWGSHLRMCVHICVRAFTFAFVRSHLCAHRAHLSAPVRYYRGNFACPRLEGFTRPFGAPRPASAAPALLRSLPRLPPTSRPTRCVRTSRSPRAPQRLPVATSPRQTAAPLGWTVDG